MVSELLMATLLLAPAISQTQSQTQKKNTAVTPPQAAPGGAPAPKLPIKMGLWEATISNSAAPNSIKTRSCIDPQSYQDALAHVPPGCTVTNKAQTATSITGDVSCTLQHGGTTKGHIDVEMPDPNTMRSTVTLTVTAQGRTVPMKLMTDSHFVSADCGDIPPGKAQIIR